MCEVTSRPIDRAVHRSQVEGINLHLYAGYAAIIRLLKRNPALDPAVGRRPLGCVGSDISPRLAGSISRAGRFAHRRVGRRRHEIRDVHTGPIGIPLLGPEQHVGIRLRVIVPSARFQWIAPCSNRLTRPLPSTSSVSSLTG